MDLRWHPHHSPSVCWWYYYCFQGSLQDHTHKDTLQKNCKIKDLGPSSYLLSIKIDYDHGNCTLRLSQDQYIIDMLRWFRLSDCMDPGIKLSRAYYPASEEEWEEMKNVPYMNAVGALMYLTISTYQTLHIVRICFLSLSLPEYVISAGTRVKGCDRCSGSSSAWSLRIPTAPGKFHVPIVLLDL